MTEQEARGLLFELGMSLAEKGEEEYCDAINAALRNMEEIQQYRAIGTVKKVKEYKEIADNVNAVDLGTLYVMLGKLQKYQSISTVEECREAVKKQKMKRPLYDKPIGVLACPCCGGYLQKVVDDDGSTDGRIPHYCSGCGQKISPYWTEGK